LPVWALDGDYGQLRTFVDNLTVGAFACLSEVSYQRNQDSGFREFIENWGGVAALVKILNGLN
jgi:hypothetical protein